MSLVDSLRNMTTEQQQALFENTARAIDGASQASRPSASWRSPWTLPGMATLHARDQSPIAGALFKGADDVVAVLREASADLDAGTPSARAAATMFGREHLLAD